MGSVARKLSTYLHIVFLYGTGAAGKISSDLTTLRAATVFNAHTTQQFAQRLQMVQREATNFR